MDLPAPSFPSSIDSKFSPSKFDTSWTDDSSLFEAMDMECSREMQPQRKAHIPSSTVSKAPIGTIKFINFTQ